MSKDLFYAGAEAVAPVGGKHGAGEVDPFIEGIGPAEFGKKGQVLLE